MRKENREKYVKGNVSEFSQTKGYFVGRFLGEAGHPELETEKVEIAWKELPTTFDEETPHFHKGGVEVNIVISGSYTVQIEDETVTLIEGDFLVVYPEKKLKNISAEENTELIVVKAPSLPDDKFNANS